MFTSDPIPPPHHCHKILFNLVNAKPGSDNISDFTKTAFKDSTGSFIKSVFFKTY